MSQSLEASGERPTVVRYVVLAFVCALAFILYIDRVCISQAATNIQEEMDLSNTHMSYVMMAFTLAYALFEVPVGLWGDRHGSRGVLARIVIGWSLFTALTGAATGFVSLIAIRFLFGMGEAGAFPNTARILSRWFPTSTRGMAQGLVNSVSLFGGAFAPVMTAYLIKQIGWRWTFVAFSVPGVIWAAAFYWWFRDDPQTHPSVNAAERQLITAGTVAHHPASHPAIPWRIVFSSPQIWLLGAVLTCSAFNSYLYFSWYPTYLKKGCELEEVYAGKLASMVLMGGALGSIGGGFMMDFLVKRMPNRHLTRRIWCSSALFLASLCLAVKTQCTSHFEGALWTTGSVMFTFATLAAWWGAVTDISGRHLGALFGLMNGLGGMGALGSQLFVGRFTDWMKSLGHEGRAQWDPIFYVYAAVLFIGACGWAFIDSSKSVDVET